MEIQPRQPTHSVEEITVVFVGDFNPKIFQPMWFAHHDLLRESEALEARTDLVHADVSSFATEWLSLQVLHDRFTAATKAEVYRPHLGDLVRNVFTLLTHSPVHQMGINVSYRLYFKSLDDWHSFGHFILPKSPWANVLTKPGLRGVTVEGLRTEDHLGKVNVTIEPDMSKPGEAVVRINDHFDMPDGKQSDPVAGAAWAVDILTKDYDESYNRANKLIENLIQNYLTTKNVDSGG